MKRLPVTIILVSLFVWLSSAASGHPTQTFNACVTKQSSRCVDALGAFAGEVVNVKAHHISPNHEGALARLWMLEPHHEWTKVALVRVRPEGRLSWNWQTTQDDIYPFRPWNFRYVLPGHGHSDTVRVKVFGGE